MGLISRFGLAGKIDLDAAEADQTIDAIKDLWNIVTPMVKEQDNVKRAEMKKKMETETLPNWLKMIETLLTSKGGIHFAGNQLTWADIAMYDTLELLEVCSFYYWVI